MIGIPTTLRTTYSIGPPCVDKHVGDKSTSTQVVSRAPPRELKGQTDVEIFPQRKTPFLLRNTVWLSDNRCIPHARNPLCLDPGPRGHKLRGLQVGQASLGKDPERSESSATIPGVPYAAASACPCSRSIDLSLSLSGPVEQSFCRACGVLPDASFSCTAAP